MVLGIGTDILLIDRISQISYGMCDEFMQNTYTDRERKEAMTRDDPTLYFATRYAGKEAVLKSIGNDVSGTSFNHVEIINDAAGVPKVTLHDETLAAAKQRSISNILISLSNDTDYAIAYAIAQSD